MKTCPKIMRETLKFLISKDTNYCNAKNLKINTNCYTFFNQTLRVIEMQQKEQRSKRPLLHFLNI